MSETIDKLKPGAIELSKVRGAARRLDTARARIDKALDDRRAAILAAADAGVEHTEIADAAGVTKARVGQIVGISGGRP